MILTEKGVQQVDEASVTAIRFTDAMIQAEIDKALRSSLSQVTPDSSTVEMTAAAQCRRIQGSGDVCHASGCLENSLPASVFSQEAELEGQAVVDNDTDDDWTETLITVITGEPITFATDLAEIVVQREVA